MASASDWQVPPTVRPKQEDYGYDLDRALMAVVGVFNRTNTLADAYQVEVDEGIRKAARGA